MSEDGKDLETAMPFSSSQLSDLQQATVALADAIDEAIGLISGAYDDTNDGGWEDDTADRFRASLVVGRSNASKLEEDVRTCARLLEEYAYTLTSAQGHLDSCRRIADHAGLLDGTVVRHPEHGGLFDAGEGMLAEDELNEEFYRRREQATAFIHAREEFELAARTVSQDSLAEFAEEVAEISYFGTVDFLEGEIEEVAQWYKQTHLPHPGIELGRQSDIVDLLPKMPDDLVLRGVRSHGGTAINVFGIAFDIYTGTDPEEAIFVGIGSALGGAFGSWAFTVKLGASPWLLVAGGIAGGAAGQYIAETLWNWVPEDAREWIKSRREQVEDAVRDDEERSTWELAYRRERGEYPGKDLKAP